MLLPPCFTVRMVFLRWYYSFVFLQTRREELRSKCSKVQFWSHLTMCISPMIPTFVIILQFPSTLFYTLSFFLNRCSLDSKFLFCTVVWYCRQIFLGQTLLVSFLLLQKSWKMLMGEGCGLYSSTTALKDKAVLNSGHRRSDLPCRKRAGSSSGLREDQVALIMVWHTLLLRNKAALSQGDRFASSKATQSSSLSKMKKNLAMTFLPHDYCWTNALSTVCTDVTIYKIMLHPQLGLVPQTGFLPKDSLPKEGRVSVL